MALDIGTAMAWILFLALFPMAFIWLRRAYRIFVKRNYEEVALKRGESPPHPEKWAVFTGMLNLICGVLIVWVLVGIPLWIATGVQIGPFNDYKSWSAIPGVTLWMKVFIDYIISRQAHPWIKQKPKKDEKLQGNASK